MHVQLFTKTGKRKTLSVVKKVLFAGCKGSDVAILELNMKAQTLIKQGCSFIPISSSIPAAGSSFISFSYLDKVGNIFENQKSIWRRQGQFLQAINPQDPARFDSDSSYRLNLGMTHNAPYVREMNGSPILSADESKVVCLETIAEPYKKTDLVNVCSRVDFLAGCYKANGVFSTTAGCLRPLSAYI